jgi:creatinine amidohydrolase
MNELATMTWQQAQAAIETANLAVLPVGSIEQHGPHLPLDTDAGIAEELATRIATELGDDAVLCPPLRYGLSEHHMAFPGTLTLRPETFLRVQDDVIESLASWGLRRVLVVNGHAGNVDALRLAARTARRDHGVLVASVMWLYLAGDVITELATGDRYGHACEVETSVAMSLRPSSVRHDLIGDPGLLESFQPLSEPPGAFVDEPIPTDAWTTTGVLGDARKATRETGDAIVDTAVRRAVDFAREFGRRAVPVR